MFSHMEPCSFPVHQGVRQGAIPSPLLYSIFIDELLNLLTTSGLGVSIDTIYCGAPMYADDLGLVADSPEELQAMLNIVCTYAGKWRYNLNAGKSFVMIFRESPRSKPMQDSPRIGISGMKKWKKETKYTTWGFSDRFPSLPSHAPLSNA